MKTEKYKLKYKLELDTAGKTYKTEGRTMLEALELIPLTWDRIKLKGVISVSKGKKKYQKLFPKSELSRLVSHKQAKVMYAKRLEYLLESEKEKDYIL